MYIFHQALFLDAMLEDTVAPKICMLRLAYRRCCYRDCDWVFSISATLARYHCQEICFSDSSCYFFRFINIWNHQNFCHVSVLNMMLRSTIPSWLFAYSLLFRSRSSLRTGQSSSQWRALTWPRAMRSSSARPWKWGERDLPSTGFDAMPSISPTGIERYASPPT